ncbi:uncharacterized protein LOC112694592 [Sipha flava]|uniref:Uncharacterized protein LOC112694592 n=1 Tax=Sipha flava TaxID=143950 RepID=A0A8B8GUA6_9HEMI|nr:uncharacterized protein LOC112694592 [Sipha flava]
MFKWGYPLPDGGVAGRGTNTTTTSSTMLPGSIVPPPPPPQMNHHSTSFTTFTPSDFQQFPYTFSSVSPPTYSWANTNSTDVMKFTGTSNPLPLDTSSYRPCNFGSVPKRKIDLDAELPQPPKMRITEEKVSASLRDMHISNEFKTHNYCVNSNVSDMDTIENNSSAMNIVPIETTKTEAQTTLVMCEELRKLNKIDSIVPQPFLSVERPTKAVVLWKPKPIVEVIRSYSDYNTPKSTVVITEITDEEAINNEDEMFVEEDNTIPIDDDEMEL